MNIESIIGIRSAIQPKQMGNKLSGVCWSDTSTTNGETVTEAVTMSKSEEGKGAIPRGRPRKQKETKGETKGETKQKKTQVVIDIPNSKNKQDVVGSYGIGKNGESVVMKMLGEAGFACVKPGYHSCDCIVEEVIAIEVKLYSGRVPRDEVDKFYRDLETNPYPIGVFLSLHSPIMSYGWCAIDMHYHQSRCTPVVFISLADYGGRDNNVERMSAVIVPIIHFLVCFARSRTLGLLRGVESDISDLTLAQMDTCCKSLSKVGGMLREAGSSFSGMVGKVAMELAGVEGNISRQMAVLRKENMGGDVKAAAVVVTGGDAKTLLSPFKQENNKVLISLLGVESKVVAKSSDNGWVREGKKLKRDNICYTFYASRVDITVLGIGHDIRLYVSEEMAASRLGRCLMNGTTLTMVVNDSTRASIEHILRLNGQGGGV